MRSLKLSIGKKKIVVAGRRCSGDTGRYRSTNPLDLVTWLAHAARVSDLPLAKVQEYADQAVAYVQRALGLPLEFDSETLPILDHYLRTVPHDLSAATELIVVTSGAYFGEVVRRRLGGRWELGEDVRQWRLVLPTGLHFAPAGLAASAIVQAELADLDTEIDAPPRMKTYLQQALERMGDVSSAGYYSLCGRLDTIEHVHEVLVTVAAQMLGDRIDPDDSDDPGDESSASEPPDPGAAAPTGDLEPTLN